MRPGKGPSDWAEEFHKIFDRAVAQFESGVREPAQGIGGSDTEFLTSIGCKPRELYDFIEDHCEDGEPSFETVLLITSARRDYFLYVQKGAASKHVISMSELPAKESELGGFVWLPRIIVKARAKLRGEMPDELMYGCGGDRPFLRRVNIHPADFLREVWATGDDTDRVVKFVQRWSGGSVLPH